MLLVRLRWKIGLVKVLAESRREKKRERRKRM